MSKSLVKQLHTDILTSSDCVEQDLSDICWSSFSKQYHMLTRDIGNTLEDDSLTQALNRPLRCSRECISSKLTLTLKSHKPQGEIAVRNLHASPSYGFAGLSIWVMRVLEEKLKTFSQILRSAEELAPAIKSVSLEGHEQVRLIRIDVKHFFMSGAPNALAQAAAELFDEPLRRLIRNTLDFLGSSQYLTSEFFPSKIWKVRTGSGMGLRHSGALADAAFLSMLEKPWVLPENVRSSYGLIRYWRFKDDILIVSAGREALGAWFREARNFASFFELEVPEVSAHRVQMLSLMVERRGNRLECFPCEKPCLGPPLGWCSSHQHKVHGWPLRRLHALSRLCSDWRDFPEVADKFIRRFETNHFPAEFLASMRRVRDMLVSQQCDLAPIQRSMQGCATYNMVLPHHPAWSTSQFHRFVRNLSHDDILQHLHEVSYGCKQFTFRVGWRYDSSHIVHKARNYPKLLDDTPSFCT